MGDYLFDKEGEDESVEALERSLSGLKYEGAPPPLPVPSPQGVRPPDYSQPPIDAYRPRAGWLGSRVPLAIAAGVALVLGIAATLALKPQVDDGGAVVPVVLASAEAAGGLNARDEVDVVALIADPAGGAPHEVTLLRGVRVARTDAANVSLLVSAEQAQILALATKQGLDLSLRHGTQMIALPRTPGDSKK